MNVWVTKYALTNGIVSHEVRHNADISDGMVSTLESFSQSFHGNDWHRTKAAAIARAEEMRRTKIASLRKQIAKLEKMEFK